MKSCLIIHHLVSKSIKLQYCDVWSEPTDLNSMQVMFFFRLFKMADFMIDLLPFPGKFSTFYQEIQEIRTFTLVLGFMSRLN